MNIDAMNFTLTHLKSLGIGAFDALNNVKTNTPPDHLVFAKSSSDDKVLLVERLSRSGLVMKKFQLADLFPSVIDIRLYKKSVFITQNQIDKDTATTLNNKYSTNLTMTDPNILNTASSFDEGSVRDFFTFCRTFGFYELTLREVHLVTIEGKLIISVNSTHDYLTGFIEVLV